MATAAAFVITEHLKLEKSPIAGTRVTKAFSPVCHCTTGAASIRLRLRHPDRVTVSIVNPSDHTVATIASDRPVRRGLVTFHWNGRNDAHKLVPDGFYHPQVELANARRTIFLPNRIQVDTVAPAVLSATDGA